MKVSDNYFDEIFDFKGQWGMPSKCGTKRITKGSQQVVLVTELYQDNPGSSITSFAAGLANQICEHYSIHPENLIYLECNPNMNSKLSFYDEEFYLVSFKFNEGILSDPSWKLLSKAESTDLLTF